MTPITAIGFDPHDETLQVEALRLAAELHLSLDQQALPRLQLTSDKLVLLAANFSPLFVDFSPSAWRSRREAGKTQGLVRACKPQKGLRILDATAGWGNDAAILASFGADVLMIERQPVIAALLEDGLRRMRLEPSAALALSLVKQDTKEYLKQLTPEDYPDVIYIDPMHPVRKKSALVKKEMQVLQQAIGADDDASDLLALALTRVRHKVVVKWPQRLACLGKPNQSFGGKTVRFDVYR
jgi:16S rRNA (guanine1516-N2)-methyltransferase